MCLYPRLIFNPKYKKNKKNGGEIPPCFDDRVKYVPIGCQYCIECKKQKARNWQLRLYEDIKEHKNGKFVTLTFSTEGLKKVYNYYSDLIERYQGDLTKGHLIDKWIEKDNEIKKLKGYDLDNAIVTQAMRWFLERWRKKYKVSLRHWVVTELGHGKTEHIHLHGIVWCDDLKELESIWQYGFVWKGNDINGKLENYVNERTVNYIIKYITKLDEKHLNYKALVLCSPGIGKYYESSGRIRQNRYVPGKTQEGYRSSTGHKIAMPVYWRNKIYTENERERLWIEKLDKGERYVCGERIRIRSEDYREYDNVVDYHRRRTEALGFMKPEFIWKKREYEEGRRALLQKRRLGISAPAMAGEGRRLPTPAGGREKPEN